MRRARISYVIAGLLFTGLGLSIQPANATSTHSGTPAKNNPQQTKRNELAELNALADAGDADAMAAVGDAYATGRGVERDPAMAVYMYTAAAKKGSAAGKRGLGLLYANGVGVQKDEIEAYLCLRQAAARGDNLAEQYRVQLLQMLAPNIRRVVLAQEAAIPRNGPLDKGEWAHAPERSCGT